MQRLFIVFKFSNCITFTNRENPIKLNPGLFFKILHPLNTIVYLQPMKKSKTSPALSFLACLLLCTSFFPAQVTAQGNLLITPKRIVFEGNKKSEEINLANIGKDTANYIISVIQIRMNEDGTFEKITIPDSAQNFADKNIRFFPRSVTLAPNEAQTVKVQIVKTNEIAIGEYRSHLYFRANPAPKPLGEEVVDEKDSVLSVRLIPIFGISIPVIIRKGVSTATVNIYKLSMEYQKEKGTAVNITFNRSGNMSVYGDVTAEHTSAQGKVTPVGVVKGMAVYAPNAVRRFHLVLDNTTGVNYHEGKLRVIYADQSSKPIKLAEAEIVLQ